MRRKERTIDQMLTERRHNADQIEALKRENELAKAERERLAGALEQLQREQEQRARADEERQRQAKLRLEMLDGIVDENK